MVEIEPRFGIGAPGVLGFKKNVAKQCQVRSVADVEALLRKPGLTKPRDFTIPGDLQRITGNSVDPRIADFLLHHGQVSPIRFDRIRNLSEVGGDHLGIGELAFQIGADLYDLFRRVGAAVVISHDDGDGQVRTWHTRNRAILVVVHNHQGRSLQVRPHKQGGHLGRRAGAIHADVEKLHALSGQRTNEPPRVTRYIGHLGSGRGSAKSTVQGFRQSDASGNHRSIHQLGLPAKRKSVPRNVSAGDGMLHSPAIVGCGLLEILVEQPRTGRPDVTARTRLAHLSRPPGSPGERTRVKYR